MVVFLTAMLATLVMGILQINTEELVLIRHRTFAAQARALAEGGLNQAMAEIRNNPQWRRDDIPEVVDWAVLQALGVQVGDGYYLIGFDGEQITIISAVSEWQDYRATYEADVTIGSASPYIIRIDNLKINGY